MRNPADIPAFAVAWECLRPSLLMEERWWIGNHGLIARVDAELAPSDAGYFALTDQWPSTPSDDGIQPVVRVCMDDRRVATVVLERAWDTTVVVVAVQWSTPDYERLLTRVATEVARPDSCTPAADVALVRVSVVVDARGARETVKCSAVLARLLVPTVDTGSARAEAVAGDAAVRLVHTIVARGWQPWVIVEDIHAGVETTMHVGEVIARVYASGGIPLTAFLDAAAALLSNPATAAGCAVKDWRGSEFWHDAPVLWMRTFRPGALAEPAGVDSRVPLLHAPIAGRLMEVAMSRAPLRRLRDVVLALLPHVRVGVPHGLPDLAVDAAGVIPALGAATLAIRRIHRRDLPPETRRRTGAYVIDAIARTTFLPSQRVVRPEDLATVPANTSGPFWRALRGGEAALECPHMVTNVSRLFGDGAAAAAAALRDAVWGALYGALYSLIDQSPPPPPPPSELGRECHETLTPRPPAPAVVPYDGERRGVLVLPADDGGIRGCVCDAVDLPVVVVAGRKRRRDEREDGGGCDDECRPPAKRDREAECEW